MIMYSLKVSWKHNFKFDCPTEYKWEPEKNAIAEIMKTSFIELTLKLY